MFSEVWSCVIYLFGLLSLVLDRLPCSSPVILSTHNLNTQQYLGTWYFIAAASGVQDDLQLFRMMDSTVFELSNTSVPDTLLLTGAIRIHSQCLTQHWTYNLYPGRDDLVLKDKPERRTLVWSGAWLNCTQCILLQEVEPNNARNRVMLYARNSALETDVVKVFQDKSACLGMEHFVRLPQERKFCSFATGAE